MTTEEWQQNLNSRFPKGARVFMVEDVPEDLPQTGWFETAYIWVRSVEGDIPTITVYPLGNYMKDFTFELRKEIEAPGGVPGLMYETDNSAFPYLLLDRRVSETNAELLASERALFLEEKEGSE